MKLSADKDYWHRIRVHTHNRLSLGSPWSLQLQFAALVGDHDIVGSWTGYIPTGPSCWTVVAVTDDGRLIQIRMEFDAEQYDRDAEQQMLQQRHQVNTVVNEASVRRLRDAVSLHIGSVGERRDGFGKPLGDRVNVRDVRLRFSRDGCEVDLGVDQTSIYDAHDLARTEELLDAVRVHSGL